MTTENRLYSRREIRWELFRCGRRINNLWNSHLASFGLDHPPACDTCKYYRGELRGINAAVRHFGGRSQLYVREERS